MMGRDSFLCEEGRPLHEVGSQLTGQPYLEIFTINRDLNTPEHFIIIVNLTSNEQFQFQLKTTSKSRNPNSIKKEKLANPNHVSQTR